MRKEADVYALGMLIYEVRLLIEDFLVERSTVSQVLSGKIPFYNVHHRAVSLKVFRGERPPRPSSTPIPDHAWEILQACWSKEPTQRPTAERVMTMCTAYASQNVLAVRPPRSPSDRSRGEHPSPVMEVWTSLWAPFAVTDRSVKDQLRHLSVVLQPHQW